MAGLKGEQAVLVRAGEVTLEGSLAIPMNASGMVLFAHGSGSSRFSPRNRFVAEVLRSVGLGTLLMDLLTPDEEALDARTLALRFDVELLAERLDGVTNWLSSIPATRHLRIGTFGSSTGAAAALLAAGDHPSAVSAVVSRGGRVDLAARALRYVRAPTLFIVGGADEGVLELNRDALELLQCEKRIEVVPDATHLFEEPGALEEVAQLAASWFALHLAERGEPARI
jgi:pimeloyl-ACP methyl ester carboxylesterase